MLAFKALPDKQGGADLAPANQTDHVTETAGVVARPPLLFLGALLLGFVLGPLLPLPSPVQGTKPTRVLVTTGIHDWSRNPIYLGMFLVYGGIGIAVRSPWILILALPLAIVMCYGVVAGGGVPGRPLR